MTEFYFLGNTTHAQMFGCVVITNGDAIVIDGGVRADAAQLAALLREQAGGRVRAWFFTHPHHDHIESFLELDHVAPEISIGAVYYNFPDDAWLAPVYKSDRERELVEAFRAKAARYPAHCVAVGDTYTFGEVSVRVLRVHTPDVPGEWGLNGTCAVYRVDGAKRSVLILADLCEGAGNELMASCPAELLQTDYTQMAHHGQRGPNKEFYAYIKPKRCLWPSPDWLWDNDKGDGFDTGPFKTVRTREWMAELGVSEHYVEKDGTQRFEI